MSLSHPCRYCGDPVDPQASSTWRRVQGWEKKAEGPTRRSGSDITLREPLDEYAHAGCIALEKSGVNAMQTGFF